MGPVPTRALPSGFLVLPWVCTQGSGNFSGPRTRASFRTSWPCLLPGLSRDVFFPQVEKEGATLRLPVSMEG